MLAYLKPVDFEVELRLAMAHGQLDMEVVVGRSVSRSLGAGCLELEP